MFSLEFVVILKSELFDLCLAMRAGFPTYLRALVSSDVDILGREEVAYLCKDVLEEEHCLLASYAKHIVSDAPASPYIVWTTCTSVLRICCKSCEHMSWKVDLRNHSDAL